MNLNKIYINFYLYTFNKCLEINQIPLRKIQVKFIIIVMDIKKLNFIKFYEILEKN